MLLLKTYIDLQKKSTFNLLFTEPTSMFEPPDKTDAFVAFVEGDKNKVRSSFRANFAL